MEVAKKIHFRVFPAGNVHVKYCFYIWKLQFFLIIPLRKLLIARSNKASKT